MNKAQCDKINIAFLDLSFFSNVIKRLVGYHKNLFWGIRVHACTYVCMHACLYVCMYLCMYVCADVHMGVCACICVCCVYTIIQIWLDILKSKCESHNCIE